ncbi:MAG: tRNA uridine-5-carboxymethylaminomethyl(34) synthesis enzyme MnmG [Bacteroidales bacterium]|nr:tRNA uridine-5-carboxymethylaminomethyl(34) synthesis enzyme MnmG [Bacteroidales bacterium]
MNFHYDVIVVGAGHAGSEAAAAAANMGMQTLLITMDMAKIAQMSCNPAIGGIAKGQIVREIDALGGYTGIVTDKSTIQFRMLNKSKGPAMWSPRAQCDRMEFTTEWRKVLENLPNLFLFQDTVNSLIIKNEEVKGVVTNLGLTFYSQSVILTNGTFLNGLIHVGKNQIEGGRMGDFPSKGLSEQLSAIGFETGRMKTGTPVRIDGRTIDFSKLIIQNGDEDPETFSFLSDESLCKNPKPCYITYTNNTVHDRLFKGLKDSPLYNGTINSIGPRYCPSIEDKIVTFADKDKHQLFLEPEGKWTNEYYLNGFSSSLPWNVQVEAMHKIPGLENAHIYRPGYAIEYDFFQPTQLYPTLETKLVKNLYFAGQINGTTGYEEAAGQGLMAGFNAALKIQDRPEFILHRDEAYIGVLIDDLINKGVDEPYRMFTSRAEHRILLRQDNADLRLTPKAVELGIISEKRTSLLFQKQQEIKKIKDFVSSYSVKPEIINPILEAVGTNIIKESVKIIKLLKRPAVSLNNLVSIPEVEAVITNTKKNFIDTIEIEIKYEPYIKRELEATKKIKKFEELKIPKNFDYTFIQNISTEAKQKLTKIKPATIGQASRISGVSPADIITILLILRN